MLYCDLQIWWKNRLFEIYYTNSTKELNMLYKYSKDFNVATSVLMTKFLHEGCQDIYAFILSCHFHSICRCTIFWRGHAGHEEEEVRMLMLDVCNDLANEDWAPAEQPQDFGQTNPKTSSMIYHLKSSRMLASTITSFSFVNFSLRHTLLLWTYNCCR
jgi:hypothetical protein